MWGAQAPNALGEGGRRQAGQGGGEKGLSQRGGGELAPHQLASWEAGRITGKDLSQPQMSGPREQAGRGGGDVGQGSSGSRDAGWSHWHGPSLSLAVPTMPRLRSLPQGKKRLLERQGPWVPRREPGPAPGPPDGWAGGQGPLPRSPTRYRKIRNGLFSLPGGSQEWMAGFPAWDPASGRPNTLLFQTDRLPVPSLSLPQDTSFPPNPFCRVSPSRDGPLRRSGMELGNLGHLSTSPSNRHLYPL